MNIYCQDAKHDRNYPNIHVDIKHQIVKTSNFQPENTNFQLDFSLSMMMKISINAKKRKTNNILDIKLKEFEPIISTEISLNDNELQDIEDEIDAEREKHAATCKDRACNFAESGDYNSALKLLIEAAFHDPSNHLVLELTAQVYLHLGQNLKAVNFAERAINISPTWLEGYLTLARARREMGEVHLASESYIVYLSDGKVDEEAKDELKELESVIMKMNSTRSAILENLSHCKTDDDAEVIKCEYNLCSRSRPSLM